MSHSTRNSTSTFGKPTIASFPKEDYRGTNGSNESGDGHNPPQVKIEKEHDVPKRKRSPKNDLVTQPEMVESIDDTMEVEHQVDTIPTRVVAQFGSNTLV